LLEKFTDGYEVIFGIVVLIAVQNTFHFKIYKNDFFLFF
jgi:hypothetical protein